MEIRNTSADILKGKWFQQTGKKYEPTATGDRGSEKHKWAKIWVLQNTNCKKMNDQAQHSCEIHEDVQGCILHIQGSSTKPQGPGSLWTDQNGSVCNFNYILWREQFCTASIWDQQLVMITNAASLSMEYAEIYISWSILFFAHLDVSYLSTCHHYLTLLLHLFYFVHQHFLFTEFHYYYLWLTQCCTLWCLWSFVHPLPASRLFLTVFVLSTPLSCAVYPASSTYFITFLYPSLLFLYLFCL